MLLIIALFVHLLCDGLVQMLLWGRIPRKNSSPLAMVLHVLYAEVPAVLVVAYNGSNRSVALCIMAVVAHYIIDTIGGKDKSLQAKAIDQALHMSLLIAAYLVR